MISAKKLLYRFISRFNDVGKLYSASASKAITTANIDTYTVGPSLTLPAGTYVIKGHWSFNYISSGTRAVDVDLSTDGTSGGTGVFARQRVVCGGTNWCRLETTAIMSWDTEKTIYVKGSATATSTAQDVGIRAIRIK